MKWPRIRARSTTTVSPWMGIIAREVEFSRGAPTHVFHAVEQADYVSIVPLTPDGKIPLVWQYRPALEAFSWELPAGMVDAGERPIDCARQLHLRFGEGAHERRGRDHRERALHVDRVWRDDDGDVGLNGCDPPAEVL